MQWPSFDMSKFKHGDLLFAIDIFFLTVFDCYYKFISAIITIRRVQRVHSHMIGHDHCLNAGAFLIHGQIRKPQFCKISFNHTHIKVSFQLKVPMNQILFLLSLKVYLYCPSQ